MKKIDDDLGGTTPLSIILKFPVKQNESNVDDEFSEWDEEMIIMRIKRNIGSQEIKWIKLLKFMIT